MKLRQYQIDISTRGAEILRLHKILCLFMQVRTGKTATALQTAENYGARNVLVLTKLKAIKSIESDYMALQHLTYAITVINYEKMHQIDPTEFDLVILDESQNFGSFPKPSKRMIAARQICAGKPIILMSGTPSPESYSQLFHQLAISSFSPYNQFILHPKWGFQYAFYRWAKSGYVTIKKKRIRAGMEKDDYSCADGNKIWKDIKHLCIQFTQEEAGFDAPVEEVFLPVDMLPETMAIIKEIEKHKIYTHKIKDRELVATINGGSDLINKLAQVSSGTLIFDDTQKGIILDPSKAAFIRSEFEGKKIAIFYRYKAELDLLKSFFPNHTEISEEFNQSDDMVFLGQIQSAREGVNLSTADALVMYNIDFSATSYFQARARIQSKERQGSAPLYWVFANGGIERKIYQAVSNKKNFTHSYYRQNYARKQNTGIDQKGIGESRMAGVEAGGR